MTDPVKQLADALRDRLGSALRVVGRYDDDSWTLQYARDDVAADYGERDIDAIADDLRLSTVGDHRQEDIYELGRLRATVRLFADGMVVHVPTDDHAGHVPTDDHAGYLVSLDEDADVTGRDVVAFVRESVAGTKS